MPEVIDTSMQPFRAWLEGRLQEIPDAMSVALRIVQGGKAGVSAEELQQAAGCSPEMLRDLLAALVAGGQVEVVEVGGELRWRAAG
jgi:hypothetical protein